MTNVVEKVALYRNVISIVNIETVSIPTITTILELEVFYDCIIRCYFNYSAVICAIDY